ncbi:hypothetical protein HC023_34675, partial [Streptomyces sp. NEAU-H3]|nr:hypothetical protein [Streptomyces sp. NEAU-H3]
MKTAVSSRAAASKARSAVRVEAFNGERAMLSVATLAAAAMLAGPADAGVILVQPQLKKAFQESEAAFVRSEKGVEKVVKAPAVSAGKAVSETISEGFSIDPRLIALPGCVGFIGALAFAASKLDDEFEEFMEGTMIKDNSIGNGVGYEENIKSTYGGIYGEPTKKATKK